MHLLQWQEQQRGLLSPCHGISAGLGCVILGCREGRERLWHTASRLSGTPFTPSPRSEVPCPLGDFQGMPVPAAISLVLSIMLRAAVTQCRLLG